MPLSNQPPDEYMMSGGSSETEMDHHTEDDGMDSDEYDLYHFGEDGM
jgi:hypothetical protein